MAKGTLRAPIVGYADNFLYFYDTIFVEQISDLLTNIQEEFNMKTTNRQVENTTKLHSRKSQFRITNLLVTAMQLQESGAINR